MILCINGLVDMEKYRDMIVHGNMIFKIFTISFLLCNIAIAGNPAYTDFDTRLNPSANSYQSKRDTPQKYLVSEERQGHLNRTKKAYKGTYHEKESMIPGIVMESPECFVHGPDTLSIGEPGIYHSRTVNSYDSFDLQTAWDISTPANMSYDQRVIDIAKPFEFKYGTSSSPGDDVVRWSTPNATKYSTTDLVTRWSTPGGSQWDSDEGKTRWEGQRDTAENTGKEEGFCRAEYTFNHAGPVRIDTTPIIPGMDMVVNCAPKYVMISGPVLPDLPWIYWSDDFNDNSLDTTKWYNAVESCYNFSEVDGRIRMTTDTMGCVSIHFDDELQSKCPKLYFERDYFQVQVDFKDFDECTESVYLIYRYGSTASAWVAVSYYYNKSANQVYYRWGTAGSWSYSSGESAAYWPDSGKLKLRKNGSNLEFWNCIDGQWESQSFTATNQNYPIHMGVTTTSDYTLYETDIIYSGIRRIKGRNAAYSAARSTSNNCYPGDGWIGQGYESSNYYVDRNFLKFDTSSIPDDATIDNIYLGGQLEHILGTPNPPPTWNVKIKKCIWQDPICDNREANYDLALSSASDVDWISNVYNKNTYQNYYSAAMDNTCLNKTGDTKYALISSRDAFATPPHGTGSTTYNLCEAHLMKLKIEYWYKNGQASFDNFAVEAH